MLTRRVTPSRLARKSHAPAGHTAIVDEDAKFVDFIPTRQLDEVMANVGKRMAILDE